jgi:tripartite-type tricarboxylate transporter receptor subunit TctC
MHATARMALTAGMFLVPGLLPAQAQDAATFFKGKTINIVVGFAPGGGSDLWARFFARHYGKHLPGEPSVIVQNMPGAGGFAAAGHVYNAAAKDGTNLLLPSTSAFTPPMMGIANARWDTLKFQWIGNMTQDTSSCVASGKSGIKSIADAKNREIVFGSDGVDESASHHPRIMARMFGFKIKIISGYKGTGPAMLAVDRGEIDARCSMWASLALSSRKDDIAAGRVVPIMQVGAKPHPIFGKAPMMRDFARNDEERQIIDFLFGTIDISRPLAVAPEVPADRVAYLREGFWKAINSPELKAEAEKAQFEISPMTGEQTQEAMRKALTVSQQVIDKAKTMIAAD